MACWRAVARSTPERIHARAAMAIRASRSACLLRRGHIPLMFCNRRRRYARRMSAHDVSE
eukprot:14939196-Alexandrium_andersonii.AAC.1